MALDRYDLCDIRDPVVLAAHIHRQLGQPSDAVSVEAVATDLDVGEVRLDTFDGFEGMLLTDDRRSCGLIFANISRGRKRARYTVAHELGHFLMEHHQPVSGSAFTCQPGDMRERRTAHRHQRQETEANRFAIELLAPRHVIEPLVRRGPDIHTIIDVAQRFCISKEAAARRVVDLSDRALAVVFHKNGHLRYVDRTDEMPNCRLKNGDLVPVSCEGSATGQVSAWADQDARDWFNYPVKGDLSSQTLFQRNGFEMTLLELEGGEDLDEDEQADTYTRYNRFNDR